MYEHAKGYATRFLVFGQKQLLTFILTHFDSLPRALSAKDDILLQIVFHQIQ